MEFLYGFSTNISILRKIGIYMSLKIDLSHSYLQSKTTKHSKKYGRIFINLIIDNRNNHLNHDLLLLPLFKNELDK